MAENTYGLFVDPEILARADINSQEKLVLAQVRQFGKYGKRCTFSNATFGKLLSVSPDRAGRVIAGLIRKKVLEVNGEEFDGRRRVLMEYGSPLQNSSVEESAEAEPKSPGENNDSASSDPTNSGEPTDSCSGENAEAASADSTRPAEPTDNSIGENTEAASADSTMQRGSIGESTEEILNKLATKIKIIFKSKFYLDTEFQRFSWYVLKKGQTPSKEPLDTEGKILNFAEEWIPLPNSTWLPEVDGEYRRAIFNKLLKVYAGSPEELNQITHIQRNTSINTIEITISGAEAWFNSRMLEMAKILQNFSSDSKCPKLIIKTQNK